MSKVLTLLRRHAVAFAALFLILGSGAYAVADQVTSRARTRGVLYACVTNDYKTLNLTTAARACPDGQRKISWNATGRSGARGPAGKAGAAGATGSAGSAGRAGPKGNTGATGATGAPGTASAQGATGPAGPKGTTGDAGAQGPQGAPGPRGATGSTGPAGPVGPAGISAFAEFFALMPPDNAATVAPGTDVGFPQNGPLSTGITRIGPSSFVLAAIGTYRVAFNVPVDEAGQLILTLDGADLPDTVTGRATGTTLISGESLIQTTVANSILTVRNPAGNNIALTITPLAGGTRPVAATLVIEQLQAGS